MFGLGYQADMHIEAHRGAAEMRRLVSLLAVTVAIPVVSLDVDHSPRKSLKVTDGCDG